MTTVTKDREVYVSLYEKTIKSMDDESLKFVKRSAVEDMRILDAELARRLNKMMVDV